MAMAAMNLLELKRGVKGWIPQAILSTYSSRRARQEFRAHLRPDDTFLVGHPKSGNTWLAYMLAVAMEGRRPSTATLANVQAFIPAVHARDRRIALHEVLPSPRMFRNEGPQYPDLYPRTIYIVRDPRAVLVSYYHHYQHDHAESSLTLDRFVDRVIACGNPGRTEPHIVRWDRQVLDWLERARRQRVKVVRYEDMIRDRRQVLEDVLAFLGWSCTAAEMAEAVERSSFEEMRRSEERHGAEPYSGTKGDRGYFTRRGQADGWRGELSAAAIRRIEETFGPAMRAAGYL